MQPSIAGRRRSETAVVQRYLKLLEERATTPPLDVAALESKLAKIRVKLATTLDPLERVQLVQAEMDVDAELANDDHRLRLAEQAFIDVAAAWARRKGISYEALREVGVPPYVLKRAGIERS